MIREKYFFGVSVSFQDNKVFCMCEPGPVPFEPLTGYPTTFLISFCHMCKSTLSTSHFYQSIETSSVLDFCNLSSSTQVSVPTSVQYWRQVHRGPGRLWLRLRVCRWYPDDYEGAVMMLIMIMRMQRSQNQPYFRRPCVRRWQLRRKIPPHIWLLPKALKQRIFWQIDRLA